MQLGWEVLAPPTGGTAQVEEGPEGRRVTLHPGGPGRWAGMAFLLVWIAGWACGELFALWALATMAGNTVGLLHVTELPKGVPALAISGFLLVWLTLWTVGGTAAVLVVLRTGWGRDVLTLGPDGWTLRQMIGARGRPQRLDPREVRRVALVRNGSAVVLETSRRTLTVTTFGTLEDRRWLCQELRRAAGLEDAAPGAATVIRGPVDLKALSAYRVEVLRDGTTRVRRTAARQVARAIGLLLLTLFWNGIVGVFVLGGLGRLPVEGNPHLHGAMAPGAWGYWLFLTPFILTGIGFLSAFLWAALGREEWRLAPDWFEIRRSVLRYAWPWRAPGGHFSLETTVDSDGDESCRLCIVTSGKRRPLESGDRALLRTLGLLLAERTGWPLQEGGQ
jgi:hypothetical protein